MKSFLIISGIFILALFSACNTDPHTYAEIDTEYGKMKVMLYNETPQHRDNFIKLANEGFYDDLLFHRVMKNFMIQGGDPDSKDAAPGAMLGQGGPGYTIPAEIIDTLLHKKGALAGARLPDQVNPKKESSGSQFYVVQGRTYTGPELDRMEKQKNMTFTPAEREVYATIGGTPFLDRDYTVFGEVIEGFDVIDKIVGVAADRANRPAQDIKMTVKILK